MAALNLVTDGRVLIPNKAAPLAITNDLEEPAIICANVASVVQKLTYNAGVPGHYFHFGKAVAVTSGEPLIAKFKEFDAVIVATKISNTGATYLYGVTVEKLKEMMQSRPATNALLDENKWLQSFKFPDPNLESLSVLVDTETDKLRDYADVLIRTGQAQAAIKVAADALQYYPSDHRLFFVQARAYSELGRMLSQGRAQAEANVLLGNRALAIEQLQNALRAGDGDFFELSSAESRLRELRALQPPRKGKG
jgi:tetratricopeptide (TPR) repeat protein